MRLNQQWLSFTLIFMASGEIEFSSILPIQQSNDGGFAGSASPDNGDLLSRGNVEGHLAEDGMTFDVLEAHTVKAQRGC